MIVGFTGCLLSFQGTYNDVPITSIAIGIEIDLREMINDSNVPDPIKDTNGFLM